MSDSAAVAVADWQPAAVANCLFQRRGLEGAAAAEHGAAPRGKSTSTQETVDSEDNASECRKNVVRLLLLLIFLFHTFH